MAGLDPRAPEDATEAELLTLAADLREMKRVLGAAYWIDDAVRERQQQLRRCLARFAAAAGDGVGAQRRARQAATHERACASLLWPGHGDDEG